MKKYAIIFALVVILFSFHPAQANGITTYPYMPNKQSMEYLVFDITGVWDESTSQLSITTQSAPLKTLTISPEPYNCPAFSGTLMQWTKENGTSAGSLKNGVMVSSSGTYYLGEAITENDSFIFPYEAILTYNPIAGETIEEVSRVFASCYDNTVVMPAIYWKYKTIAHYKVWGGFSDVWRTGLREYTSNHVYNYIFAKNIGMVDFWHGSIDENNNVIGTRFLYNKIGASKMIYSMTLTGGMNARRAPSTTGAIIKVLPAGTIAEGDVLSADGKWLTVLMIDGVQVTEPTFLATYTTSGKLVTNPLPPEPLPFQVGLNIVADSPLQLSRVNADGTRTLLFSADVGEYVIAFTANDSNRPFIRME